MSKYINSEKFAHRYECLEKAARNHLISCDISDDVDYHTQIQERFDVQKDLRVFPGIEIVMCKNCKLRSTDDCPMFFEEWIEVDDDGYIDHDIVIHDRTNDDGFCYMGKELANGESN